MLLLKNCRVLPELTEGYSGTSCDVLLDGEKIKGIYACGECAEAAEDTLELNGKYLLPGFFDLHVHLTLSGGDTLIDNAKTAVQQALDAAKFAKDSLLAGFTTIRDVGSSYNVAIDLRNAINEGKMTGPNIYASGKIVTATEVGNDFFEGLYSEADGDAQIWKAVRQEMKDGADFIKIMGTGAVMNPGGEPGQPIYRLDELKSVVAAAAFKDTYVATHCHGTRAIKDSITAGVRTLEHASILDDEAIEMLKGNDKTYIVPTLKIIWGLADSVPESSTFMKAKAKRVLECIRVGIRKAYDEGLVLGFGTDTGAVPLIHGENGDEFMLRKEFWNMDEIDIIRQATINSAVIIGKAEEYGTIKAGKYADLVVVDGDPIKDISVLRNKIDTVIKSGAIVK